MMIIISYSSLQVLWDGGLPEVVFEADKLQEALAIVLEEWGPAGRELNSYFLIPEFFFVILLVFFPFCDFFLPVFSIP
jgi:hypothetical protein